MSASNMATPDTSGVRHRTCRHRTCLYGSGQPAGAEVLRLADLLGIGAVVVGPGGFEHGRQTLEPGVREERAEFLPELALEDVRVPVAVRAEGCRRIVDVQRA